MRILITVPQFLVPVLKKGGHHAVCAGPWADPELPVNYSIMAKWLRQALGDFHTDLYCHVDDGSLLIVINPENALCENGFEELFTPGASILPPCPPNDAAKAAAIAAELGKPVLAVQREVFPELGRA